VVHLREHAEVQVAGIARHQERRDLTRAASQHLVAECPAFQHHEHRSGLVTLPDKVASRLEGLGLARYPLKNSDLLLSQFHEAAKLVDEPVDHDTAYGRCLPLDIAPEQ